MAPHSRSLSFFRSLSLSLKHIPTLTLTLSLSISALQKLFFLAPELLVLYKLLMLMLLPIYRDLFFFSLLLLNSSSSVINPIVSNLGDEQLKAKKTRSSDIFVNDLLTRLLSRQRLSRSKYHLIPFSSASLSPIILKT